MGVLDDFSRFLETRLEEFLQNNPHLELQALLEQLREQEQDTRQLLVTLDAQKQRQEQDLLALAQDIQLWHGRIAKAQQAGRQDLAEAAQEREAALLRQGNLLWGQMEGTRNRLSQSQALLAQIQSRQTEVQRKAEQMKAQPSPPPNRDTTGWNQGGQYSQYKRAADPLEAAFQDWELNDELEQLKQNLRQ
jgi:uncharacterized protein (TIGR04376 family)